MTREELINALADMETFSAIPKEFLDRLEVQDGNKKKNGKKKGQPYNAGTDPRISKYLAYCSRKSESTEVGLQYMAFSIVANLAYGCLGVPTGRQMDQMLELSGYTAEEMESYVQGMADIAPEQVPSQRLAPTVFLVSRVLYDALYDPSEWQRTRRREPNPSLERLRALVAYMQDNGLLYFFDKYSDEESEQEDGEAELSEYDEYVLRHAEFAIKLQCITSELKTTLARTKRKITQLETEMDRECERAKSNRTKKYKATNVAPLAVPVEPVTLVKNSVLTNTIANTLQEENEETLMLDSERAMRTICGDLTGKSAMSVPEMKDLIGRYQRMLPDDIRERAMKTEDEVNALIDEYNRIVEDMCELRETMQAEKDEWAKTEFMPSIAESAFRTYLEGKDETYKLKVNIHIWKDFQSQSTIGVQVLPFKKLEDEETWDSMVPEANGKLGLKIFDESDLVTLPMEYNGGGCDETIPVASALAKMTAQALDSELYIRKSQVKLFKDAGYSSRRARDFAIVLATMDCMHNLETYCNRLDNPALYNTGTETGQVADVESAEAERAARVEAERKLKQAQKENQASRHEIRVLQREVDRLKREVAEAKEAGTEPGSDQDEQEAGEKDEGVEYPYRTNLKVVVYGGFDVFHKELTKLLPDIRVVESSAHVDVTPVRNADIVFLQTNKTNHSNYWAVRDACKNNGVPYVHLNYASAKRCAKRDGKSNSAGRNAQVGRRNEDTKGLK